MQHKLKALDAETLCHAAINLNSFTDAPALQTILEQSLEKKSGARHAIKRLMCAARALALFSDKPNAKHVIAS